MSEIKNGDRVDVKHSSTGAWDSDVHLYVGPCTNKVFPHVCEGEDGDIDWFSEVRPHVETVEAYTSAIPEGWELWKCKNTQEDFTSNNGKCNMTAAFLLRDKIMAYSQSKEYEHMGFLIKLGNGDYAKSGHTSLYTDGHGAVSYLQIQGYEKVLVIGALLKEVK